MQACVAKAAHSPFRLMTFNGKRETTFLHEMKNTWIERPPSPDADAEGRTLKTLTQANIIAITTSNRPGSGRLHTDRQRQFQC